jgi:hypothetical protein
MSKGILVAALAALHAGVGIAHAASTASVPADELRVAFLYNFAKFTEWPADAWSGSDAPFVIAIEGNSTFAHLVESAMRDRTIHGRRVEVRTVDASTSSDRCHLLYVAEANSTTLERVVAARKPRPVLTVGEGARFLEAGGVVGLVESQGRIQFEIDLDRARRNGLDLSSKLLALAQSVRRTDAGGD